jgi:hypothetical protein
LFCHHPALHWDQDGQNEETEMKRLSGVLLSLLLAGGAAAGPAPGERPAGEMGAESCGWLVTERECDDHQRILFALTDPVARQAYLKLYDELMRERAAVCTCSPAPPPESSATLR